MAQSRLRRDVLVGGVAFVVGGAVVSGWHSYKADSDEQRAAKRSKKKKKRAKRAEGKKLAGKGEKAKAPAAHCNICGNEARFRGFAGRKNAVCPTCRSKERHRLLMHYLEHETNVWSDELDMLHFSPAQSQEDAFRQLPKLNYKTADYLRDDEDLQLDLTKLEQPEASWDVLLIYHILEHIPDDKAAMSEMFRVLRPGGRAFVQVPIEIDRKSNYEDPTITTDKGRAKAFGQKDHVRKYGSDGFRERLEQAGFEVDPVDYLSKLEPDVVEKHRLSADFKTPLDERIWVLTKPLDTDSGATKAADADEKAQ